MRTDECVYGILIIWRPTMKFKLENVESERAKELVNLIREYNSSNRESSKSELLNIYMEDEQGNILAGMVAETFGNWLEI